MEPTQASRAIIDGRYRILHRLGQGSSGTTYAAERLATGQTIALKELSLRGLQDWKKIELFEREARILKTLNHPAIPQYIDFFQVDTADNRWFYLAQDLAEGTCLADWVEGGGWVDEAEARRIATAVLDVLIYLHGLNPPVIHRDLKPQNIIRRDDGHIYLVDFGAVQTVYRDSLRQGSTVVGTYGYMAPEQFRGQAVPATDLYGLGATLLFLLTHQSPADLPQERLRINFRPYVAVSAAFADWLEQLIDPLVEDRFASAQVALATLNTPKPLAAPVQPLALRPPAGTKVQVYRSPTELVVTIPPPGLRGKTAGLALLSLFWNGFILLVLVALILEGEGFVLLLLAPFGVFGFSLISAAVNSLMAHVRLSIDRQRFSLTRRLWNWRHQITGNTADLVKVEVRTGDSGASADARGDRSTYTIALLDDLNQHKFGTPLTVAEKAWLVDEIEAFIQKVVP
ncbi:MULTISPECIES: serine/threonine-protein kinase [Cyanophyceae]|uniref:serine/threonine protein kinase n=1 Tax=Cyanophyceae TaxID=3028117 RepID=UPI0016840B04|nr:MULTISPECIES: serine/threonine-protein kinase [Cyanophyceae]MBD1918761.1 serine/threonine protein kinase [Phormidium sp. FACHB-77]MBD2033414.1 serine/threonine protein kinase [Phormidium sp. FACHB-322]MBD2053913.1 serine/threonine protein kinase [Leptolyngbya sp. FACHB-60]